MTTHRLQPWHPLREGLQAKIEILCVEVLGRSPSPNELATWHALAARGMSMAALRARIARMPEARLNVLYASQHGGALPGELRRDCLERLAKGAPLEAVAYHLLGRMARP
jgi:hypothetical protein